MTCSQSHVPHQTCSSTAHNSLGTAKGNAKMAFIGLHHFNYKSLVRKWSWIAQIL